MIMLGNSRIGLEQLRMLGAFLCPGKASVSNLLRVSVKLAETKHGMKYMFSSVKKLKLDTGTARAFGKWLL